MQINRGRIRHVLLVVCVCVGIALFGAAGRIILSPKAPDRDYRQELIDLSRSVVPATPESLENAERLAQLLEEDAQRWRFIYAQQRENPDDWPVAIPNYQLVGPRSLSIRTIWSRQWTEEAYEFTQCLYETHVAEISPRLEWLTSETPVAAVMIFDGSSPEDLPDFADTGFMRLPYLSLLEIAHYSNLLQDGRIEEASISLDRILGLIRSTDPIVAQRGRLARLEYQSLLVEFLHELIAAEKFPTEAAERTLRQLQAMRLHDPGWKHVIEGERLVSLSIVRVLFDRKQRRAFFQSNDLLPAFLSLYISERDAYNSVNAIYDRVQSVFLGNDSTHLEAAYNAMMEGRTVRDRILQHVFPNYWIWLKEQREADEGLDIVFAMLALEAYRSDYGEYPSVLADLVPKYLDELPTDAFSPSGDPLRYRTLLGPDHTEQVLLDYVLWSVGPDGVDGGGRFDANSMVGSGNPANTESIFALMSDAWRGRIFQGDIILNITSQKLEESVEHARIVPLKAIL